MIVSVVLLVAATAAVTVVVMNRDRDQPSQEWQLYALDLFLGEEPVTLDDIEALRPVVPDEQNGALMLANLEATFDDESFEPSEPVAFFNKDLKHFDPFEGVPRSVLQATSRFVDSHRELIESLSKVKQRPVGRLPMRYDQIEGNPLDLTLPSLRPWKRSAMLLHANLLVDLAEGNVANTVHCVDLQHAIADTLREEPNVIVQIVRSTVVKQAIRSMELVLRVLEVDSEFLDAAESVLDQQMDWSSMRSGWLCERALMIQVFDQLAAGTLTLDEIGYEPTEFEPRPTTAWIRENQVNMARMWGDFLEGSRSPGEALATAEVLDRQNAAVHRRMSGMADRYRLARSFAPSFSILAQSAAEHSAQVWAAGAGLASERYRRRYDRWPETLADLVPDFLAEVQADPFTGAPYRIRKTENGICIYSIGTNRIDDSGDFVRPDGKYHQLDIGFRLVDSDKRKLVILEDGVTGER